MTISQVEQGEFRQQEATSSTAPTSLKIPWRQISITLIVLLTPLLFWQTWTIQHSCNPFINWKGWEACPFVSLAVTPSDFSVVLGRSERLYAEVALKPTVPKDQQKTTNRSVVWTSSDTNIATVDEDGVVNGVSRGLVKLIATLNADKSIKSAATVTVLGVEKVTIAMPDPEFHLGEERSLLRDIVANVQADKGVDTSVTWTSSNPKVAKIEDNNKILGVSAGQTTLTATSIQDESKKNSIQLTILPAKVLGIRLEPENVNLKIGKTQTLTATVECQGTCDSAVNWSSDALSIASVEDNPEKGCDSWFDRCFPFLPPFNQKNPNGLVTALAEGTATITATSVADPKQSALSIIQVSDPLKLCKVEISPEEPTLYIGESMTLGKDILAEIECKEKMNKQVTWTSSNPEVAKIEDTKIQALSTGQVTLTATSIQDEKKQDSILLSVKPPFADRILLDTGDFDLEFGKTKQISASIRGRGNFISGISWSSDNPSVAKVEDGLVTALSEGVAKITTTALADLKLSTSVNVQVFDPLKSCDWQISPKPFDFYRGEEKILGKDIDVQSNCKQLSKQANWISSNPEIITVEESKIQASSTGKATLTAVSTQDERKKDSIEIEVLSPFIASLDLPLEKVNFEQGAALFSPTCQGRGSFNRSVMWASDKPSVATIKNGCITPLAKGKAKITATSVANPQKSASASVKVAERTTEDGHKGVAIEIENPSQVKTEDVVAVGGGILVGGGAIILGVAAGPAVLAGGVTAAAIKFFCMTQDICHFPDNSISNPSYCDSPEITEVQCILEDSSDSNIFSLRHEK